MSGRLGVVRAALMCGLAAIGVAGCGSASSSGSSDAAAGTHVTTLPSGQLIVEAADRTDRAPGYRIAATISLEAGQTTAIGKLTGTVERHGTRGAFDLQEQVAGKTISLQMRTSGQTLYMTGIPGLSTLSHGRQWIRFDLGAAEHASGSGDLQTEASSDPTRYLAYLRAVGADIQRIGTATVDGVATTRYHALIDLDRYVSRVPDAERAEARRSVASFESAIGGDTLPADVWIDQHHRIREMQVHIPLCADGQSVSMSITMNLGDFGKVPAVTIPPASDSYNLTSTLQTTLSQSETSSQTAASSCSSTG